MSAIRYCEVDDCLRLAKRSGRCDSHDKKKRYRTGRARAPRAAGKWDALFEAALHIANYCDTDDPGFQAAAARLRMAALRYQDERPK